MFFFFQAEDGIRDLVRSRGLGDVYKRQGVRELDRVIASVMRNIAKKVAMEIDYEPNVKVDDLSLIHI